MSNHSLKGGLFESLILSELIKGRYNQGLLPRYFFWRDKLGREIDCIIENAGKLTPVEIKSGKTSSVDYFKDIAYWNKLSKNKPANSYVVFGGDSLQKRSLGTIVPWNRLKSIPN